MARSDIVNVCFSRKRKSLEFQALALGYGNFKSGKLVFTWPHAAQHPPAKSDRRNGVLSFREGIRP